MTPIFYDTDFQLVCLVANLLEIEFKHYKFQTGDARNAVGFVVECKDQFLDKTIQEHMSYYARGISKGFQSHLF